ncbi:SDR family oxidoreductase [Streptomyces atratus]|uniref:MaoC like domain-containing protein n=1 Tax=Streptomyces atratus TaxID=1893 RepID=A0A1K1ZTA5_STRAR|nr:MaoC like domain-containing protein [Streptomyces atratus]
MLDELLLRLNADDMEKFAAASGDRNPQYGDPAYARRTYSGACVVPGALAVIAALAAVPAQRLRTASVLGARFTSPLFPGRTYRATVTEKENGGVTVVVREGTTSVLHCDLLPGDGLEHAVVPGKRPAAVEPEPSRERSRGQSWNGAYGLPAPEELRALADLLGARSLPDALLGALGWASWFTGMRVPGKDMILSGLQVRAGHRASDDEPRFTASVATADARSGTLVVRADCTGDGRGLEMELRTFQRRAVPAPNHTSATSVLPAGDALAGNQVLAVGGSRGIGAAIVSVLASQGASVWATQRAPGPAEALREEFGDDRVRPLLLDARDPKQMTAGVEALAEAGVRLDGLVLSAGPAVLPSSLHPDTVDDVVEFVDTSLTLALRPLTAALPLLKEGGWIVLLSSGAVEDVPARYPQYYLGKTAVEALGRFCATRHGMRVLLARAPKMWTDLSNGPLGGHGTVPTSQVASAIVGWVLGRVPADESGLTVLSPRALTEWTT